MSFAIRRANPMPTMHAPCPGTKAQNTSKSNDNHACTLPWPGLCQPRPHHATAPDPKIPIREIRRQPRLHLVLAPEPTQIHLGDPMPTTVAPCRGTKAKIHASERSDANRASTMPWQRSKNKFIAEIRCRPCLLPGQMGTTGF